MAFNGSGSFSLPGSSSADYETGDTAVGTDVFAKFQDLADGLSNTLCRDGQSTVTASISFSGQRIVNLGDAVAATDALGAAIAPRLNAMRNDAYVKGYSARAK